MSRDVSDNQPSVRDVYRALVAHLAPHDPADVDERKMIAACKAICGRAPSEIRELNGARLTWPRLLDAAVAARWGCATPTLRAWRPSEGGHGRRRPSVDSNPAFFDDLRTYGAARFRPDGEIVKASLNKGPDALAYRRYTAARVRADYLATQARA